MTFQVSLFYVILFSNHGSGIYPCGSRPFLCPSSTSHSHHVLLRSLKLIILPLSHDTTGIRIGPEPTTDRFTVLLNGPEERTLPGTNTSFRRMLCLLLYFRIAILVSNLMETLFVLYRKCFVGTSAASLSWFGSVGTPWVRETNESRLWECAETELLPTLLTVSSQYSLYTIVYLQVWSVVFKPFGR